MVVVVIVDIVNFYHKHKHTYNHTRKHAYVCMYGCSYTLSFAQKNRKRNTKFKIKTTYEFKQHVVYFFFLFDLMFTTPTTFTFSSGCD